MSQPVGFIHSTSIEDGDELDPTKWKDMSLAKLWVQHGVLNKRLIFAQQIQHEQLIKGLAMGIEVLEEIINHKSLESDKIKLM